MAPIPPKGSPSHVLEVGLRTHFEITQGISQSLASDRTELPEGLSKRIDKIVKLTPRGLLRHQRRELRKLRELARSSEADVKRSSTQPRGQSCRSSWRLVLRASRWPSSTGTFPSLGIGTRTTSRGISLRVYRWWGRSLSHRSLPHTTFGESPFPSTSSRSGPRGSPIPSSSSTRRSLATRRPRARSSPRPWRT